MGYLGYYAFVAFIFILLGDEKEPDVEVAKTIENVGHARARKNNSRQGLLHDRQVLGVLRALYGDQLREDAVNILQNMGAAHFQARSLSGKPVSWSVSLEIDRGLLLKSIFKMGQLWLVVIVL
jgi:hypothetical protein